jgi:hypothetical protein
MVLDTRAKQVAGKHHGIEHHGIVVIGAGFDSAFFLQKFVRKKARVPVLEWGATTRMIGSSNAAQTADRGVTRSAWSAEPTAGPGRRRHSILTTSGRKAPTASGSNGRSAMTISSLSAAAQAVARNFATWRKHHDGVL